MIRTAVLTLFLASAFIAIAQNVTVRAVNRPAAEVFRSIMEQTDKNFVYSSDILKELRITVDANKKPLKKVLDEIFRDTDIKYELKGKNVILKRKKVATKREKKAIIHKDSNNRYGINTVDSAVMLREIVVESNKEFLRNDTKIIGANTLTGEEIRRIPALLGESDVIKSLHFQPGVTESTAGIAGMNVHGGDDDQNMLVLDKVPLYQQTHLAGLFSTFNTDIINKADFYKSAIPARYDGRLSSFTDIQLRNGNTNGHHGSARLGLTSAAFNISGPIGGKTTYLLGIRRSWLDLQFFPIKALINNSDDDRLRFQYYFLDFNAKVTHRFSQKINGFVSAYLGNDRLTTGSYNTEQPSNGMMEDNTYRLSWGNLIVQTGLNYNITPSLKGEFSLAYLQSFSGLKINEKTKKFKNDILFDETNVLQKFKNNIDDLIFRGDFVWGQSDNMRMNFGASYVRHLFSPDHQIERYFRDENINTTDSLPKESADEANIYIEDNWKISEKLHATAGLNASLFHIGKTTRGGISPRINLDYKVDERFSLQAAYSRTMQYIHRLSTCYLSLPSDRWIPVNGEFKPMTSDKISIGARWQPLGGEYSVSLEGYYKFMHNLIEYKDDYYLYPVENMWDGRLTSGNGTSKGIDIMAEKKSGKITGHISYSLAWTDRKFTEKNGGLPFPARFDHRHTINILMNWNMSKKVSLTAAWTGHSGNRFTLMPQRFESPDFGLWYMGNGMPLGTKVNNFRLPFYHRLDVSCTVKNKRGYWTFGLYNAYCNMNTVAIVEGYKNSTEFSPDGSTVSAEEKPVFKKYSLLPIIPSISYTWQF